MVENLAVANETIVRKTKVLILGASGMLGVAVFRAFLLSPHLEVVATIRNSTLLRFFSAREASFLLTDIDVLDNDRMISLLNSERPDIVINCTGLIKQFASASDPLIALPINALFPHRLARLCEPLKARLIHISTDCVFSGSAGNYTEQDVTDALDLYGRSKLLGEVAEYENAITLRTSIIGRGLFTTHSLVDWFLSQEDVVPGYSKAIFSGLPSSELAAIIRDVVVPHKELAGLYHVSAAPICKLDLLHLIARQYGKDIKIVEDDRVVIDRSLNSSKFTRSTGYHAPDWTELIRRMYESDFRRANQNV
jgi:dTDP-4-dehydrorhamnose reductase